MRRTYNEWADTVNNLPYDLVLVDMLSDWQADGIRLTKCINNLETRIAELEAENKKAFDLVRKLRIYCIWANWDNPDTEDEFNEFDVEVCKWLSKFMEREE